MGPSNACQDQSPFRMSTFSSFSFKACKASIEPPCSPIETEKSLALFSQTTLIPDCSSKLMERRWTRSLSQRVTAVDMEAINRGRYGLQASPEYSQTAYCSSLAREVAVGNYFDLPTCQFSDLLKSGARETMVLLIEELHKIKGYRELTLFFAVNIADKYLAALARLGAPAPKIVTLGVVSLLLAVKLNESVGPNFGNMVGLINQKNAGSLTV